MAFNAKARIADTESVESKDVPAALWDDDDAYPDAGALVFNIALTIVCFLAATVAVSLLLDAFGG